MRRHVTLREVVRKMTGFTVVHLQEDRLDHTLPLVRMAAPLVTAEGWRRFARRRIENDGGILAALAGDGRPHGIAAYLAEECLTDGRTLHVEPMVTFEIHPSAPVRTALCRALELIALAQRCESLRIVPPGRGYADARGAKARAWASLGLEVGPVAFVKHVVSDPAVAHAG